MQVFEHSDPEALRPRAHPWTVSDGDAACRYHDLRAHPELIRSALEDFLPWGAYPSTETFYRLVEWLNGPDSALESNDCAFTGPAPNESRQFKKSMMCSGRLMVLFRDLSRNTSRPQMHDLTQSVGQGLSETDVDFAWGAVGLTLASVVFSALPGPVSRQRGEQLMVSFWGFGDGEAEVMEHLDRTLKGVSLVLERCM